jgi:curved DNA-binding protein CbpA
MKFDSPIFDKIRVKPSKDRTRKKNIPGCEWAGCKKPGGHRAPKGRGREKEYWNYCIDHVREYNHSYNYFSGMSDDAIAAHQKDAMTGHRPTWKMGQRAARSSEERAAEGSPMSGRPWHDPYKFFEETTGTARAKVEAPEKREARNAERKALEVMGLEPNATSAEVKNRFKALVKRHHPDANAGDRSTEDRLVEIIQSYNYLKSSGFC